MRVTILTVGTRGDVQPYVALGIGLQAAGYRVRLVTEATFEPFVRQYDLEFAPLRAEFAQLAQTDSGKAALSGKKSLSLIREVMPMLRNMLDDAWEAACDSDVIICHPKAMAGQHIAEKLAIPCFLAMALPALSPTAAFAVPALGDRNYGALLNRLSYSLVVRGMFLPYRKLLTEWRAQKLKLPPGGGDLTLRGRPIPKLYAYSQYVVPNPSDWDDFTHVTGYWFLPPTSAYNPPAALQAFLEAGPAPLYVGFGSMTSQDAAGLTTTILQAAHAANQRVVMATGWGGLVAGELPQNICALDAAPHDWLFPHCAAVVHHGGAGTTGTGLWAGKPTLVCPFFGDQPFWGRRVVELGVGPAPIPQKRLTAPSLAAAMNQLVHDEGMRQRAQELGAKIRAEDGIAAAIKIVESYTGNRPE